MHISALGFAPALSKANKPPLKFVGFRKTNDEVLTRSDPVRGGVDIAYRI